MRPIDADALKEELGIAEDCDDCERLGAHGCVNSTWAIVCDRIESAPTIDAVPVVRCKDCEHWDEHSQYGYDNEHGVYGNYCMLWTPDDDFYAVETPADGFCYNGERKDDE